MSKTPTDPHEPSASVPVIGLPVSPTDVRTDVWVPTVAVREHVAAVPKQTGRALRLLVAAGLVAADKLGMEDWDPGDAAPDAESDTVNWRLTAAGQA